MKAEVLYQVQDGVATITMNRPQSLNSMNPGLIDGLHEALTKAAEDTAVRCLVLTGAGRAFTLRGKGIPRVDGRGRGDEHVVVTIRVPKKLSSEQRKAVQKLADVLKEEPGSPTREEKGFLEKLRDFISS